MTVLDTQAAVALMAGEPAAAEVAGILRERESIPMMSALSIAETADVIIRRLGRRVEVAHEHLNWLVAAGVEIMPVDEDVARLAGILRSRHWHRDRRPISMADCVVLATGMVHREPVATADAALIGAARAEGHPVVILPDSKGRRPA